jgi:hypothetical protein
LFAEMKEAADLVAKFRQCLIVRQGELFHAADSMVRDSVRLHTIS